jgi:hypothetical protein
MLQNNLKKRLRIQIKFLTFLKWLLLVKRVDKFFILLFLNPEYCITLRHLDLVKFFKIDLWYRIDSIMKAL